MAAVVTTGTARAQGFVSPSLGFNAGSDVADCQRLSDCEERHRSYGVGIGYLGGLFGFEQEFTHAPDFFGTSSASSDNHVTTIMSNLLVAFPAGPIRPYGSVGLGAIRSGVDFNVADTLRFRDAKFGWSFGGGLLVLPTRHFGLRADIRHYRGTGELDIAGLAIEGSPLNFSRMSAGVVFRF
ncbi:MAG: outer membrane protein [Vicinamibacterales bacterium]